MWFCSYDGISRFDGRDFTNFTTADGLPERHVYDFLETRRGKILLATRNGLARLNPKGTRGSKENPLFTVYLPDDPKARGLSVLFEDKDGEIWAGTGNGLYRAREIGENFEFEKVPLENKIGEILPVTTIIQDRGGVLWVGTSGIGLFRILPSGQIEHYSTANGLPNNLIESMIEDSEGRIWAGMRENSGGLVRLANDPVSNGSIVERIYTTKDGLPDNWIPALFQTSDNKFWVATVKGLCRWQGEVESSVCRTYSSINGLCDNDIWSLTEDNDGNLWIGSPCGVKKLGRYGFTTYTEADGLRDSFNHSIFQNRAGELFVHTLSSGLFISRFENGKFQTVRPNLPDRIKNFGWGVKQTVTQDSKGAWWIPTAEGLFRFPDVKDFTRLSQSVPEELKISANGNNIFRLYEDSRGDVWISIFSSRGELWRWERRTGLWQDFSSEVGFDKKSISASAFLEDRNGNLWIGAGSEPDEGGLIRYRDGKFRVFDQTDGAPPGWTRDLFLDHAGRLWLANTTWGLLRIDNPNSESLDFVRYTTAEGLSSNGVTTVTEDEFGRIYVGTGRGLDRLTPETGQIENFTTADGLPKSFVEVAFRDQTNALWFTTTGGLARFQPEPVRNRKPPTVLITGLQTAGISQSVSILGETEITGLDLSSAQNQVSINFIGLGATPGEKLRFEYRITGEEWNKTNEHTVNFGNLAAGTYRFELRAVSSDRIISPSAVVSFRIAAPIWQRWWFIVLAALLVATAIFLIYRNRLRQLIEIERTRTRIATDLHDDIGTNLSKISLLSGIVSLQLKNENAQNKQMLKSIAEISRESVNSMSDIVWAINPHRDSVLELARRMREFAEEIFVEKNVRVLFDAPDELKPIKIAMDTRRDLYLIFKEAVTNSAKYSECTQIEIVFQVENGEIFLEIKDNGRGFDDSSKSDGNGLENMQTRAGKFGAACKISSKIGGGTKIAIRAPIEKRSDSFAEN